MNEWQTNTRTHTQMHQRQCEWTYNRNGYAIVRQAHIYPHITHAASIISMECNKETKYERFFIFVCLRCLIWSAHGLRFSFVWDSLLISDYTVLPVSVCFITVRRKVNAIKWKIPSDYSNKNNNNNGRNYANWQKKPAEKNIKSNKKRNMQYIFYCHQK